MKSILGLMLVGTFLVGCIARNEPLYIIYDGGRYGFIDKSGDVMIKPVFLMAGEFSQSLAPARTRGKYGYIDRSGRFVIQPQFDFALPFRDNLAKVYLDGRPQFIDLQGHIAFDFAFAEAEDFQNGQAMVVTRTKRRGIIDRSGKLLVDTLYSRIDPFHNGSARVTGLRHDPYSEDGKFEVGLVDSLGHQVVPFGIYEEIDSYSGGYYQVTILDHDSLSSEQGFIDPAGKLVYRMKFHEDGWIDSGVSDGLFRVTLKKKVQPAGHDLDEGYYYAYMNFDGKIFVPDSSASGLENFYLEKAFVIDSNRNYKMINKSGKQVGRSWEYIMHFNATKHFVRENGVYGIIDSTNSVIVEPKFDQVYEFPDDPYFAFLEQSGPDSARIYRYGIADAEGHIIVRPVLQSWDRSGFHHGLIRATINDRMVYFDRTGKEIWKASSVIGLPKTLDIDFMVRGYFLAQSTPQDSGELVVEQDEGMPRQITPNQKIPAGKLSVVVLSDAPHVMFQGFRANEVWVCNATNEAIIFGAQDTRLDMKVQALSPRGVWRDIEYLPNSWCGNSYHTLTLLPNQFWTLKALAYEGEFRTKMRIEISYIIGKDDDGRYKKQVVYSNEYSGSINMAQFWRKQEYFPSDIMDPYDQ